MMTKVLKHRRLSKFKPFATVFVLAVIVLLSSSKQTTKRTELVSSQLKSFKVIYIEKKFNGLGAQTLRIIDAFALAIHLNASFCIREARYWNYGCAPYRGWSCYFKSFQSSMEREACKYQDGCQELSEIGEEKLTKHRCVIISSRRSYACAASIFRAHSRNNLQHSRQLAVQVWQLNDRTRAAVQRVVDDLELPRRYLALHIRRGDKAKERPLVPLRRYVEAVELLQRNNDTIFVATDDGTVLDTLRKELVGKHIVSVAAAEGRRGHNQMLMNRMYLKRNEARVVTLLAEIEVMRKATIFIGTFSSNLGRLVHVLREHKAMSSVSLDDRWASGVAFRTFGQRYCGSNLANEIYCNRRQGEKI
eukprot:gb/GEZJ01004086.1/.p1 GENE.gb/GEZJ01004086.1/~~gb/GEZJ01004086.1/.p1  ORF type:complete len:362 (+),score=40.01 gb/GEZJ01004086.1/:364-1449(+)